MRTIPELAEEVLGILDGCNLSGLVHGWSASLKDMRRLLPNAGTEEINRHPINQLWASKVHELSGMGISRMTTFSEAIKQVKDLLKEDPHVTHGNGD